MSQLSLYADPEYLFDKPIGEDLLEVDDSRLIQVGSTSIWLGAGTSVEYNDNINLDPDGGLSDIILRPNIFTRIYHPFTDTNAFNFIGTLGVSEYVNHHQFNTSYANISPDSIFRYTMEVKGNLKIEILDRFAFEQDPTTSPLINRTVNFKRFENGLGVTTTWALENSDVGLLLSRDDIIVVSEEFKSLGRTNHRISPYYTYELSPAIRVGVSYAHSFQKFKEKKQNDSNTNSFGVHSEIEWSDYLRSNLSIGYVKTEFKNTGSIADDSQVGRVTFSGAIEHELTEYTGHAIRFRGEPQTGFGTNSFSNNEVSYTVNTRLNDMMSASMVHVYQRINESGNGAKSTRYSLELGLDIALVDRASISFLYRFLDKSSSNRLQSYTENKLRVDVTYSF